MKARNLGLVVALVLLAGACSRGESPPEASPEEKGPSGPQTYTVVVDGPSPQERNVELSAYFPARIKVRPGDTVVFDNRSTQAPHTVSFGVKPDRSNNPSQVTKALAHNPAVFVPCYAEAQPTADLESCPGGSAPPAPAYAGQGYWNSGVLAPAVAPEGRPRRAEVVLDDSLPVGDHDYVCLIHPFMAGTIEVVRSDADRLPPGGVADQARREGAQAAASAAGLPDASAPAGVAHAVVAAGWGDRVASINRFNPVEVSVPVGQTVAWSPLGDYEPHTITFESPFTDPGDSRAFPPGGVPSGSEYAGGFSNSGFIGPGPFDSGPFKLRFTEPGNFPYVCVIHPGMGGVVRVT